MNPFRKLFRGQRSSGTFRKRYELINHFIERGGYGAYLEIGISTGRLIERVRCERRVGVDPHPKVEPRGWTLHRTTSDAFFLRNRERFDIVFIDGLHLAEQVLRDIAASLRALEPGGVILLHDCSPRSAAAQLREGRPERGETWNGDVWKAIVCAREMWSDLFCRVIDADEGIGIIVPRDAEPPPQYGPHEEKRAERRIGELSWEDLERGREALLGLLPPERRAIDEALQGVWRHAAAAAAP